jgi:hypothetical protein
MPFGISHVGGDVLLTSSYVRLRWRDHRVCIVLEIDLFTWFIQVVVLAFAQFALFDIIVS